MVVCFVALVSDLLSTFGGKRNEFNFRVKTSTWLWLLSSLFLGWGRRKQCFWKRKTIMSLNGHGRGSDCETLVNTKALLCFASE